MKLATKITLLFSLILVITLGSMAFMSYHQMNEIMTRQLETELQDVAYYVSQDLTVKNALTNQGLADAWGDDINARVEAWRIHSNMDFIVVMDMNGIRLTHPVASNIGLPFEGGDQVRVLTEGASYISEALGTLGVSKRAFTPVLAGGRQVGAVSVGTTLVQIEREMSDKFNQFVPFILISLIFGVMAAFALTSNIKASIMGLEPREIALVLKEKETILDNVKEGIITLDQNGELVQYNQEAARILRLTEQSPQGILKSLKDQAQQKIEGSGDSDREMNLNDDVTILYKYSILKNNRGKVLGQVINFRDRTEVKAMAEELTGFKRMAWSLRAQNHEFLNKLHTISGLIQLGESEEALKYITKTAHGNARITDIITRRIRNVNIAALVLSKYFKAEESRVNLEIADDSWLEETNRFIRSDDLETVIGNLLENSLDAVTTDGTGRISIRIHQDQSRIEILVSNNGPKVPESIREKIFAADFSTKPGQRGYGLYFIQEIVRRGGGSIHLSQDPEVTWQITIPDPEGEQP